MQPLVPKGAQTALGTQTTSGSKTAPSPPAAPQSPVPRPALSPAWRSTWYLVSPGAPPFSLSTGNPPPLPGEHPRGGGVTDCLPSLTATLAPRRINFRTSLSISTE